MFLIFINGFIIKILFYNVPYNTFKKQESNDYFFEIKNHVNKSIHGLQPVYILYSVFQRFRHFPHYFVILVRKDNISCHGIHIDLFRCCRSR